MTLPIVLYVLGRWVDDALIAQGVAVEEKLRGLADNGSVREIHVPECNQSS
ncbi:MAG: hypothetical protein OXU26_11530 [Acidobacteriota bacterium]|nr:hypothetical protein [Chloroflexota bacterium]MDE2964538.1 hypothetical protein [Acidobacteriota bacterium]